MKILSISDKIVDVIYSPACREKFPDVDLLISCGDLPYYYVEYVLTILDKPLYYVRGNHASTVEYAQQGARTEPRGAIDLHRKALTEKNLIFAGVEGNAGRLKTSLPFKHLILAGVEGSIRYNTGDHQYTQGEMWLMIYSLVPRLLWNRLARGRALDVFVTHAPPCGIHDKTDRAHVGVDAFRWLDQTFRPKLHLHGHIHIYQHAEITETLFGETRVINTYGHRLTEI